MPHQQLPMAAGSACHAHAHLDSTLPKHGEGYHNGISGVAGGATEPTRTYPTRALFSEVMVNNTFDLLASLTKMPDEDLAGMLSSLRMLVLKPTKPWLNYRRLLLQIAASSFGGSNEPLATDRLPSSSCTGWPSSRLYQYEGPLSQQPGSCAPVSAM